MESTDSEIITSVKKRGRGTVFFADEYAHYSNPKRVQKAMAQLVEKGLVIRVARGIYCYPKKDKVWNTGFLPPSYDDIANAIAKKEYAKIAPTGIHALNRPGLSEQIPMRLVYLTSGRSRTLQLTDGQTLQFVHASLKNLAFHNKTAMLVTFAFKEIGKDNLTEEQKEHILQLLKQEDPESLKRDLSLMQANQTIAQTLIIVCGRGLGYYVAIGHRRCRIYLPSVLHAVVYEISGMIILP